MDKELMGFGLSLVVLSGLMYASPPIVDVLLFMLASFILFARSYQYRTKYKNLRKHVGKDALTNTLQRQTFLDRLNEKQDSPSLGLAVINIKSFRGINDTFGNLWGDHILSVVGSRLNDMSVGVSKIVGRIGGDEFAVAVDISDTFTLDDLCMKIEDRFQLPIPIEGHAVDITVDIGCALYPKVAKNISELVNLANLALNEARKIEKRYVVAESSMLILNKDELYLISSIKDSIEKKQLSVVYQPKIRLSDERLVGVEALLRWDHPILGCISPTQFIPIAEKLGIVNLITQYIIDDALSAFKSFKEAGIALETIAVNISTYSVMSGDLLLALTKAIVKEELDPKQVVVEIPEPSITDTNSEAVHKALLGYESLGVKVAIDNLANGYIFFDSLLRLSNKELKIRGMNLHEDLYEVLVKVLTILAKDLGSKVTLCDVETKEALDKAKTLGIDYAQGYYICRPMPAFEFIAKYRPY